MAEAKITVNISLKEILELLCQECIQKVRKLVREKIADELVDKAIGRDEG